MNDLPHSVRKLLTNGQNILKRASESPGYDYRTFSLDCALLPEPGYLTEGHMVEKGTLPIELKKAGLAESFFEQLPNDKKPCLYRFEIVGGTSTNEIWDAYAKFQDTQKDFDRDKRRASAAVKKKENIDFNTRTLYVGKVKRNVGGRMAVHAGYYHVGTTAGLQLWYWAKELQLKLLVHVIEFKEEMGDFVSSLELDYSREHRPLFGMQ